MADSTPPDDRPLAVRRGRRKPSGLPAKIEGSRVHKLERNIDEKDRSRSKLRDAHEVEIGKLNGLITQMGADHSTAISNLRAEKDKAVADLECHVAAETVGRREAEQEVEEQKERIKQLIQQQQINEEVTRNVMRILEGYVSNSQRRGAEVTEPKGLLIPVKDVEVGRGKGKGRNRDSAVVIQEEDEDEDLIMADDV
jgi:hypothetical protein